MRDNDFFEGISDNEVPEADAAEQMRPLIDPLDDGDTRDDGPPPLESDESDWQEQRLVVEEPDPDEIR